MAFYSDYRTCRFCKAGATGLLQYSTRSYAHTGCFLDAGHKLSELQAWKVAQIPYHTLKQRNLLEEAQRIINAERDRQLAISEQASRDGRLTLARFSREKAAELTEPDPNPISLPELDQLLQGGEFTPVERQQPVRALPKGKARDELLHQLLRGGSPKRRRV